MPRVDEAATRARAASVYISRPQRAGGTHRVSTADAPSLPFLPLPSLSQFKEMAEQFPGDGAAANGFGRRHLHGEETRLLFEAEYPVPPDMRVPGA